MSQQKHAPSVPLVHRHDAAGQVASLVSAWLAGCRPGGIRQQFKAASPMVEGLLKGLKKEDGLQGPLSSRVLDQGDAVGAWYGKDQGGPLAAVLFATSETLKQVQFGFASYMRSDTHIHESIVSQCRSCPYMLRDLQFSALAFVFQSWSPPPTTASRIGLILNHVV